MKPALSPRVLSSIDHDDGVNAWSMTRLRPPLELADLVGGYCDYGERTGGFSTRRELPHAQGVLIVNLGEPVFITGGDGHEIQLAGGEAFVAGVHLRPALSRSSGAQRGVQIELPLSSLRRLLGVPMRELLDQVVPLTALLGRRAAAISQKLTNADTMVERIALLDAGLIQRFSETAALDARQMRALQLLRQRSDLDISGIAAELGCSRKHLADLVHDAVGVGPRSYRRLLRFENLLGRLAKAPKPDWVHLALAVGYCDQSHLIREFSEFAGMSPRQFLARSLGTGGVVEA